MSTHTPENWPRLFEEHFNAGNLDAVMKLYEPQARIVAPSGETNVGSEAIRHTLAEMITAKTKLHAQVVQMVQCADVAMLYTNFTGTTTNAHGDNVPLEFKAIEILRRQPDGTWQLIMGDPKGRI